MTLQHVAGQRSCGQVYDACPPQTREAHRNRYGAAAIQGILGDGHLHVTEPMGVPGINPDAPAHNRRARCPRASRPFLPWVFWQASPLVRRPRRKKSSLSSRHRLSRNRSTASTTDRVPPGRATPPVRHIAVTKNLPFIEPLPRFGRTEYCVTIQFKGRTSWLMCDSWRWPVRRRSFWRPVRNRLSRRWRVPFRYMRNPAKRFVFQVILCPARTIRPISFFVKRSASKIPSRRPMSQSVLRLWIAAESATKIRATTAARPAEHLRANRRLRPVSHRAAAHLTEGRAR